MNIYWATFKNTHGEWKELRRADDIESAWSRAESYAEGINAELVQMEDAG